VDLTILVRVQVIVNEAGVGATLVNANGGDDVLPLPLNAEEGEKYA
jgi:hypothetical protein